MLRRYFDYKFATAAILLALTTTLFLGAKSVAKTATNSNANVGTVQRSPFSQYSKTSEFAQRLQLLEFADRNNPKSKKLDRLLNDMRQKNYPIQRVESEKGGEELFQPYRVKSVPTFVLLFDGKELGRVTVGQDDVATTRDRLLKLFQRGRDSVAANPRQREKEPVYVAANRPKFGFLFPGSAAANSSMRAQSLDLADAQSTSAPNVDSNMLESREEELSAIIGDGRLNAGTARVVVDSPDGGAPRVGAGVVVHYNEEYQEALIAVAASLFVGINDAFNTARVNVDVYSVEAQACENKGAQCVYCDLDAGIAFVAAQVDHPATPVAFLPKRSPLEVGERAIVSYRDGNAVVKSECDVLSLDQRRFYQSQDGSEENGSFLCVEISNAPSAEHFGAGLFVERNERYYFAGLCVSSNSGREGLVAPVALVSRSLLVNRNLATVYRDQIAGKFDSAASDLEIDAAISRLIRRDVERRAQAQSQAQTQSQPCATSEPASNAKEATSAASERDVFVLSAPQDRTVAAASESERARDVSRAESALDSVGRSEPVENEFPADAADAFARTDAAANALRESEDPFVVNSDFQFADLEPAPTAPATSATQPAAAPEVVEPATAPVYAQTTQPAPQPVATPEPVEPAPATVYAQTTQPAPQPVATPEPVEPAPATVYAQTTQPAPQPVATSESVAQPRENLVAVAEPAEPSLESRRASRYAAADELGAARGVVRPTTFANAPDPEAVEAFDREEEAFEAGIDALRRRSLEGAEIICIVNWTSESGAARETEVVRLPRRTVLENPRIMKSGVELVEALPEDRAKNASSAPILADPSVPAVSTAPNGAIIK